MHRAQRAAEKAALDATISGLNEDLASTSKKLEDTEASLAREKKSAGEKISSLEEEKASLTGDLSKVTHPLAWPPCEKAHTYKLSHSKIQCVHMSIHLFS